MGLRETVFRQLAELEQIGRRLRRSGRPRCLWFYDAKRGWTRLQELDQLCAGKQIQPVVVPENILPAHLGPAYMASLGAVLGQIARLDPSGRMRMLDSLTAHVGSTGDLSGLHGPLISLMITAETLGDTIRFKDAADILTEHGGTLPSGTAPTIGAPYLDGPSSTVGFLPRAAMEAVAEAANQAPLLGGPGPTLQMAVKSSSSDPELAGVDGDLTCRVVGGVVGTAAAGGVAFAAAAGAPATGGTSLALWLVEAQVGFFAGWFAEEVCTAIYDDEDQDEKKPERGGSNRSGGDSAGDSTYPNPENSGLDEVDIAVAAATISVITGWRAQTTPLLEEHGGAYGPLKIPRAVMAGYWTEPPGGWHTPEPGEDEVKAQLSQRIQPLPPEVAAGPHVTAFAQVSPKVSAFNTGVGAGGSRTLRLGNEPLLDDRGLVTFGARGSTSGVTGLSSAFRRIQGTVSRGLGR